MTPLSEWSTFYQVVGTAAGSLTGLQFIMMALIADLPTAAGEEQAGDAFASPTIVHFCAALFLTTVAVMPWHTLTPAFALWTATGLAGFLYTLLVLRRMRSQTAYKPVFEDWLFHTVFPIFAYLLPLAAALLARNQNRAALFTIASASLSLLFIGVHNAWDSAVYIVFTRKKEWRQR